MITDGVLFRRPGAPETPAREFVASDADVRRLAAARDELLASVSGRRATPGDVNRIHLLTGALLYSEIRAARRWANTWPGRPRKPRDFGTADLLLVIEEERRRR
jgi:hypothetical protein